MADGRTGRKKKKRERREKERDRERKKETGRNRPHSMAKQGAAKKQMKGERRKGKTKGERRKRAKWRTLQNLKIASRQCGSLSVAHKFVTPEVQKIK